MKLNSLIHLFVNLPLYKLIYLFIYLFILPSAIMLVIKRISAVLVLRKGSAIM